MAELAPEAELAIEGVAEPREPDLYSVERLVRRREGIEP
jgi:hypothetical protein